MGLGDIYNAVVSRNVTHPEAFILIVLIILFFIYLSLKNYIHFGSKKAQKEHDHRVNSSSLFILRLYIFISRVIIVVLLVVALAGPFTVTKITTSGDKKVQILEDNSLSMQLFESGLAEKLENNIKGIFPTTRREITSGEISDLGDKVLASLR